MLNKKIALVLIFLTSCTINPVNEEKYIKDNSNLTSPTSSPLSLPTFNIPNNVNIEQEAFLKKEDYIKYLECALNNSKDDKEKDNLRKNIDLISKMTNELKFKPDTEYYKYCSYLVPQIPTNSNEKILNKDDYIKYLNCAYENSKIDIQKEAIKRNIEIVKNSPDNFKFKANIEFLEKCSNLIS
jgi:hypothetical protein